MAGINGWHEVRMSGRAGCFAPVNARLFESRSVTDFRSAGTAGIGRRLLTEVARRSAVPLRARGRTRPPDWRIAAPAKGRRGMCPVLDGHRSRDMVDRFGSDAEFGARPLHRRRSVGTRGSAAGASTARRTARIVAVEAFVDQPPHELPQCHVGIDMREQPFELLQPAVAVRVDDRLELPAPLAQRSHPIRRHRQRRIHVGQHLRHLPRALAGRLLHQRLLRRYVQHRSRLWFRRRLPLGRPCRRRPRRAVRSHGRSCPGPGPTRSLAITKAACNCAAASRVSEPSQSRSRTPSILVHSFMGVDPAPGGGVAVAERALHVVEQAGEAAAQVHAAGFDLAQMIDDEDVDLVIEASQLAGLLQELVVGEAGYSGGDVGVQRGSRHRKYTMINNLNRLRGVIGAVWRPYPRSWSRVRDCPCSRAPGGRDGPPGAPVKLATEEMGVDVERPWHEPHQP